MRFNCGLSPEEKFRNKAKAWEEYCSCWHIDFAILPVRTIDGPCVWLEKVEFKVIPFLRSKSSSFDEVKYRLVGSVKENR